MGLYYQESGDKNAPLMVFLHGGGVSSWMWEKQIQYFTNYHCLTIDLPEQGKSSRIDHFTIRDSAEKIIVLTEKMSNGKKIVVIGFSLGAQVAIQMISMKPDLISSAVINSALVRPNAFFRKMIRPSVKFTFPLISIKYFARLQSKILYVSEEHFEAYYEETSQMKADSLIRILKENMSFEIPNDFNKARCKILVTVGEKEKGIMKKSAIDIVSSNSNCLGIIIPSVGHGVSLQKPNFFNQMVEKWLLECVLPINAIPIK
ncbi:alpha/beta fold hydrolase [Sporosarcina sp. A2]|uniref:alpha/beta fold hydrolase n=1 Tax=Sporosarcina sp. A2 TaxID=3393449 RepID=UPI003D7A841F